ncbi:MAG: ribose-5-phosphate isomerase RpiA [Burkholderia sp.]|nr:ribose-5-phosphate isomerase RpiA [Burkholderia sp.]
MDQDQLKRAVCQAAINYLTLNLPEGAVIGVGTGSTTNYFIDALSLVKSRFHGVVSSSTSTTYRLKAYKISIFNLNDIKSLPVYIDSADEIDDRGAMIKGGGGALTKEKIIASVADTFICIADYSKHVQVLGAFPLPIEIIPIARTAIGRRLVSLGGIPLLRLTNRGLPYITENGNEILDVNKLNIFNPFYLEKRINAWPGVVTVGLFAERRADLCLLGTRHGIKTIIY